MYQNTVELARRISKNVVAFDLEHTGGAGGNRAITDFGAMLVTPEGAVTSYSSLVKPPDGVLFNSYVCRLTGIYPSTVADAPGWEKVLAEFVLPNRGALWVGFNSRTCDTPLVYKESQRLGHELEPFDQLDLMRVHGLKGGLAVRLSSLVPDFDTSGAHRGLKDALMTLALLEAQLPMLTAHDLDSYRDSIHCRPKALKAGKEMTEAFLVKPGVSRHGQPWHDDEISWLRQQFSDRKLTIGQIAVLNGRSAFAVACALAKQQVISPEECARYRHPA